MIGRTLGHYRIESKLGEGGMGVVYRAFDLHLDRPVAIKMLRPETAILLERKRRFIQEAKAASALNHPNIVHVYDIDTADGADFIAMEFVPGKTLDQFIGRNGLSLHDTLKYGIQIADTLAHAHAAGIVHRDLKPANVIVGDDGRVKLVDFGLAKLLEHTETDPDAATATMRDDRPQTEEGAILGTVAYMSPEQAEGKSVDARSDIFSFGSMLYEMATGRRAFEGATKISTLSAILHLEPKAVSELAPQQPAELEKIISRCLRKDPDRRTRHMDDVKLALEDLKQESESIKLSSASRLPAPPAPRRSLRLAAIAAGALILIAAGLILVRRRNPPAPARSEWTQITNLPDSVSQPALSPDGRMIAFIRGKNTFLTPGQVYVKMLPGGDPVQLTHDDSLKMSPAFSTDGSRIAYTVAASVDAMWDVWDVPVLGGEPRRWLPNASGLVWIDKTKLLFSEVKRGRHMAVVTAEESRVGSRDIYLPPHERGMAHRSYPSPDGKTLLLVEMNDRGTFSPCRLLPMDGSSAGRQVSPPGASCTFAAWSPDSQWMYFTSNAGGAFHIWRQRFPSGEPEQITSGPTEEEGVAMAPDGRSFITAVGVRQSAVWLHDSRGDRQISLEGYAHLPKFTPDGKKLCYLVESGTSTELRLAELESGRSEPLLPGFPVSGSPLVPVPAYDISPDGERVVVSSRGSDGKPWLYLAPLDRRSPPRKIPNGEGEQPVFGLDGELFFRRVEGASGFLYRIHEDGTGLRRVTETPVQEVAGSLSKDHQWLVVVSPPAAGGAGEALAVPLAGGSPIRLPISRYEWSRDGKYLFVGEIDLTHVIPLAPGQMWPRDPAGAIPSTIPAMAGFPGAHDIPSGDVSSSQAAGVYAYTRTGAQRNLYRIPVP